jgi:hypothetical protein
MPWHFGGDEVLSYAEADAYVSATVEQQRAPQRDSAKEAAKRL